MALPQAHIIRGMRLAGHNLSEYVSRFGRASDVHPFGDRVHDGLLRMTSMHYTDASEPYALWIYYSAPPSRHQQNFQYGSHQSDYGSDARWWPATGTPRGHVVFPGWCAKCIGQEWLGYRFWFIHHSRVRLVGSRLCPDASAVIAEDRLCTLCMAPRQSLAEKCARRILRQRGRHLIADEAAEEEPGSDASGAMLAIEDRKPTGDELHEV